MLKKQIYWMLLLSLVGFASCGDDDGVGSVENISLVEFDFPQGDAPWDKEIEQIAKDWGMYIIYKGIDSTRLNRMWSTPFYNQPIYVGNPVSEQDVQLYLDLVKNWLLGSLNVNNKDDKAQLPYYFYFINDLNDGNPRSPSYQKNHIQFKKDGLDYWSLSFTSEELAEGLLPEKIHAVACAFSYPGLKVRFQSGEYKVAPRFADISNYEERIGYRCITFEEWYEENAWQIPPEEDPYEAFKQHAAKDEIDPVNVFQRRGFVPQITENFVEDRQYYGCPTWMPWLVSFSYPGPDGEVIEFTQNPQGQNIPDVEGRILQDFLGMIRFAMFYTQATVREKFPVDADDPLVRAGNEKINQKYDLVVEYMKTTYGIDLQKYAAILDGE